MGGKSKARQERERQLDEQHYAVTLATAGKYHASFDRRAHDYALLGATDEQIAQFLEVSPATVSRWQVEQPTFRRAIAKARVDAPAAVVRSLHRAARGFKAKETKVAWHEGKPQIIDIVKTYPPNVQAGALILANASPVKWQDRRQVEHSGTINLAALVDGLDSEAIDVTPSQEPAALPAPETQDDVE